MKILSQIFSGLRFRLLLLVVLACAPLLALTLHSAWEDRRRQVAAWRQRAAKLKETAIREEEELAGATRQLLLAVSGSAPVRTGNQRGCKRLLDELFASYPRYANLGVITTNGEVLASALPLTLANDQAGRQFFRRALETKAFSVDVLPAAQRIDNAALSFTHPVLDQAGEVRAVVFATLDSHWFDRASSELLTQLPRGATWTEVSASGTILTRYPAPELWVGRPLAEESLLESFFAQKSGVVEAPDVKGVRRLYAFASMPSHLVGGTVVAALSIPTRVLFAQANRVLGRNLRWSALALGLALTLGWLGSNLLVVRPVNALVKSSARLASGDLSARTGLAHGRDELGRLTLAFDQMAEALEQREADHLRSSQKLQTLTRRLVDVQEAERRHIARELHDEIGQTLTAAELNLQAALRLTRGNAVSRRLTEGVQAVERVLDQVRDLSLNLRPSMLDDLGLEPALRWYTQRQAALTGLKAEFRSDPLEGRIDTVVETECFRVAQEALTNVVRHAVARAVAVELSNRDGHLHLSVRDDGVGFDVSALREQAVRGASLGLLSMEERASLAGGALELNSTPGQGTEVHAWFPLKLRVSPPETETHG
jgi:signal transduction histidine kinase